MNNKANKVLAFMATAMAIGEPQYQRLSERKAIKPLKVKKPQKGHREFFYGENSVWALNQDNADRKAEKLGYNVLLNFL